MLPESGNLMSRMVLAYAPGAKTGTSRRGGETKGVGAMPKTDLRSERKVKIQPCIAAYQFRVLERIAEERHTTVNRVAAAILSAYLEPKAG